MKAPFKGARTQHSALFANEEYTISWATRAQPLLYTTVIRQARAGLRVSPSHCTSGYKSCHTSRQLLCCIVAKIGGSMEQASRSRTQLSRQSDYASVYDSTSLCGTARTDFDTVYEDQASALLMPTDQDDS
eukprot:2189295-Amphidinium_carterae.2